MSWTMSAETVADNQNRTSLIVKSAFARVDIVALAVAAGVLGAVLLFVATAWLLLRGAPPGVQVGPHLGLLAHYLPGYSVTWSGCAIGSLYGFLFGSCSGALVGALWNLIHYAYLLALSQFYPFGRVEL
ncbi:MAG: hypothetical protein ACXWUU_11865 [Burkholderiales bacterium]